VDRIGFIGLGLMGGPMAANVAHAGYRLAVYNRTVSKTAPLRELGAEVVSSPREVAENSAVVITALTDGGAVLEVLDGDAGLLAGASDGMVLIDMSTTGPEAALAIGRAAAAHGVKLLEAPVVGSVGPAREGTLGILVGGEREVFEAQRDLLGTMGAPNHIFYMGPQGTGAAAKLCINLMVAAQMVSLAEALTLAAKSGVDVQQMAEVVRASGISSRFLALKSEKLLQGDYEAAFPLEHMHKDLGLVVRAADTAEAAIPATAVIHQLYTAARAQGYGSQDFAALYRLMTQMAGLDA
jgi:3-hydroxyisobutyrate dehydrogenase-like beta-hydroxyacid dehydrogenase